MTRLLNEAASWLNCILICISLITFSSSSRTAATSWSFLIAHRLFVFCSNSISNFSQIYICSTYCSKFVCTSKSIIYIRSQQPPKLIIYILLQLCSTFISTPIYFALSYPLSENGHQVLNFVYYYWFESINSGWEKDW